MIHFETRSYSYSVLPHYLGLHDDFLQVSGRRRLREQCRHVQALYPHDPHPHPQAISQSTYVVLINQVSASKLWWGCCCVLTVNCRWYAGRGPLAPSGRAVATYMPARTTAIYDKKGSLQQSFHIVNNKSRSFHRHSRIAKWSYTTVCTSPVPT